MKEEIKRNCVLIKRFDGFDDYISLSIEKKGNVDDNLHEKNNRIVIYVGEDPTLIIPSIEFPSVEVAIEEIIDKEYSYKEIKGMSTAEILLKRIDLDIRAWSKNNYDSHFLYYKISFPLLKRLREVGETKFQIIFQQEILKKYATGPLQVKKYLDQEGYLELISDFF